MMMPMIFNDNFDVLDHFYPNPWFDKNLEKKLYGHRFKNMMSTDIKENEKEFEMIIDLPGFKKDEVTVELEKGYLTISAEKSLETEAAQKETEQKDNYIRRERCFGSCKRSFYVGDVLTVEDIKASFQDGILTLIIPKKDPEKIAVNKFISIEG